MNTRKKIFYPNEHVYIQMRPELASEIGRDAALVFQLFVWIVEGDPKYLLWHEGRYWTPQSLSTLRKNYLGKIFRKGTKGNELGNSGIESKITRILHYLTDDMKLLLVNKYSDAGMDDRTFWYAVNYEEVCRLNGVSVMDVADSGERRVFIPNNAPSVNTQFSPETDSKLFHSETTYELRGDRLFQIPLQVVSKSAQVVSESKEVVSLGETTVLDNRKNKQIKEEEFLNSSKEENKNTDLPEEARLLLEEINAL